MSWLLVFILTVPAVGLGILLIEYVLNRRFMDALADEETWSMGKGTGMISPLSVITISTGTGYATASQTNPATGIKELRKQIMDSKISLASEILDWANLSEKADEALTSPTPDYDAIDKVLLASGVSRGSMMDPIGLIKALSPAWRISMSNADKDLNVEVRTNDYAGYASRASSNISFSIAACIADITFRASVKNAGVKFSSDHAQMATAWGGLTTSPGGGLTSYHQAVQTRMNAQGQVLPSLFPAPTTTKSKPPGST